MLGGWNGDRSCWLESTFWILLPSCNQNAFSEIPPDYLLPKGTSCVLSQCCSNSTVLWNLLDASLKPFAKTHSQKVWAGPCQCAHLTDSQGTLLLLLVWDPHLENGYPNLAFLKLSCAWSHLGILLKCSFWFRRPGGEAREPASWRTLTLPVRTALWLGLPYSMLPLAFKGLKVLCF